MLSRLVGPRGRIPDTEIIYAVGDIHGRDDLLNRLHAVISEDLAENAQGRRATVVYLGDYVDRGPSSKAVLDCLLDHPIGGADSIFLKGNHEDAMLRFLDAQAGGESWLTIGGGATARSYGVTVQADRSGETSSEAVRTQLNSAIPARHLEFLRKLQLTFQAGDYLFVHAGIRPGRAIDD
jgi:serine/threonine protein phosphatase 1